MGVAVSDDDLDLRATTDQLALRALAERYAAGVDRRDRDLFLSAFHADGVLVLLDRADPTQVTATRRGHAELGDVTELIARYDKTFHFIGNARYEVDGDRATGEVYCVARRCGSAGWTRWKKPTTSSSTC